jgi:branched-chain amino acid transport system substrate-binding protein
VQITKDVHAALPTAKILGPDGMCTSAWTNPKKGGVPASIDPLILCTIATLDLSAYPGGKQFLAAYKAKYGTGNPDPYAIYGYEAMKLGLQTIAGLGANGSNKADVLKALLATKNRHSVLGTYSFNSDGDTTLKSYGLYKVGPTGDPVFDKTLTPTKVL